MPNSCIITGGSGLCGLTLARQLAEQRLFDRIYLFDLSPPLDLPPRSIFLQGDLTDRESVHRAFKDAKPSAVFHLASYGMSGREQMMTKRVWDVNVNGTRNVLEVVQEFSVPRLIYTSTYNVLFGGKPIINGTDVDYFPPDDQVDEYSRTKTLADMMVLKHNGAPLKDGGRLRTVALRPAGIYGEGEMRHFPRILRYLALGFYVFTIGPPSSLVDWLHVENFALAHVQAERELRKDEPRCAGKGIAISDGKPINNFEFFRPLAEGLGYRHPTIMLPVPLMLIVARFAEVAFKILLLLPGGWGLLGVIPTLSRCEVNKCGVTHYFSMQPAKDLIGYEPKEYSMEAVVEWYRERGWGNRRAKKGPGALRTLFQLFLPVLFLIVLQMVSAVLRERKS